jgi:hypothetical protein
MALAILVGANPRVMKESVRVRLAAGSWKFDVQGGSNTRLTLNDHTHGKSVPITNDSLLSCGVPTIVSIGIEAQTTIDDSITVYAAPV